MRYYTACGRINFSKKYTQGRIAEFTHYCVGDKINVFTAIFFFLERIYV